MKFKGLLILGMFLSLISIQKGYSWIPIVHSPKIYGQVVDSVTGQPIENAIVSVVYYKDVPAIVDRTSKVFASYVYITDKEGKFIVPVKTSFHMPPLLIVGSWFAGRNVTINHPLYESTPTLTGENRIKITKNADGSLNYDVDLISLEEKYVREVEKLILKMKNGEINEVEGDKIIREMAYKWETKSTIYEDGWYWIILEKNNINYDLENIFIIWERIASNFDKYFSSNYKMRDIKKSEEKIKKILVEKK